MALQLPLIDSDSDTYTATPRSSSTRLRTRSGRAALAVVPDRPEVIVEIAGPDWLIDDHTKQVGLAGVAAARRALAAAVGRSAA